MSPFGNSFVKDFHDINNEILNIKLKEQLDIPTDNEKPGVGWISELFATSVADTALQKQVTSFKVKQ